MSSIRGKYDKFKNSNPKLKSLFDCIDEGDGDVKQCVEDFNAKPEKKKK
jgi:hypothetical protein